jgi:hypothetical protein
VLGASEIESGVGSVGRGDRAGGLVGSAGHRRAASLWDGRNGSGIVLRVARADVRARPGPIERAPRRRRSRRDRAEVRKRSDGSRLVSRLRGLPRRSGRCSRRDPCRRQVVSSLASDELVEPAFEPASETVERRLRGDFRDPRVSRRILRSSGKALGKLLELVEEGEGVVGRRSFRRLERTGDRFAVAIRTKSTMRDQCTAPECGHEELS